MACEDGSDEGMPEAGAKGTERGEGVAGWLGEGVVDGGCKAWPEVVEVGLGEGWEVRWGCGGGRWYEGERGRGDESEEFGAGVWWEMDVWDTGFVEEIGTGGGDDEDG